MSRSDWSRAEVEAIVEDYLSMLASELAGVPYNKAAHRRSLLPRLNDRSEQSVEFKHANISAALLAAGLPYIEGYKPRSNYQGLLADVVVDRAQRSSDLLRIVEADADRPMVVPEVQDILDVLVDRPTPGRQTDEVRESAHSPQRLPTNYLEREARNRSLGRAGEQFVLNYEIARLLYARCERLASKVEHTAAVRGDSEGYDILSFDEDGTERLIEVKTTKYGMETPFFVTRNEVQTSDERSSDYHLYRLFAFNKAPRLYTLPGSLRVSCRLSAVTFVAQPL
jgi:hypothetical protein